MRKQEHIRCSCSSCKRGAGTAFGQFIHKMINRKIRHTAKRELRRMGDNFESITNSTPYTD